MTISIGDSLPDATFRVLGSEGIEALSTSDVFAGKTVVLFAVPGAFTPTCHLKHLPGFIEMESVYTVVFLLVQANITDDFVDLVFNRDSKTLTDVCWTEVVFFAPSAVHVLVLCECL